MNRLIIIGNGFDLAHKMKTSYYDFIFSYIKKAFLQARNQAPYRDELIEVRRRNTSNRIINVENIDELKACLVSQGTDVFPTLYSYGNNVRSNENTYMGNPVEFEWKIKNKFIEHLLYLKKPPPWAVVMY
jgi:Bacteriophage abortive infection AbiH